jgi:hypothetical protein
MLGPILPRPEALVTGFPSPSDAVAAAVNLFDATVRGGSPTRAGCPPR